VKAVREEEVKLRGAVFVKRVGWEVSTGQSAVMLGGWGVTEGWLMAFLDRRVGERKTV